MKKFYHTILLPIIPFPTYSEGNLYIWLLAFVSLAKDWYLREGAWGPGPLHLDLLSSALAPGPQAAAAQPSTGGSLWRGQAPFSFFINCIYGTLLIFSKPVVPHLSEHHHHQEGC